MAIGTSKPAQACPATSQRAYLAACSGRVALSVCYLLAAAQSRRLALACPGEADAYKARARYWLAMAGVARRSEARRLP